MALIQIKKKEDHKIQISLSGDMEKVSEGLIKHRLPILLKFIEKAVKWFEKEGYPNIEFGVQLHDEDPHIPCFKFDSSLELDKGSQLIPDPYVLASEGYLGIRRSFISHNIPKWSERLPIAIWRGSSTGEDNICTKKLNRLPRYRLCKKSNEIKHLLDAKITSIVQCRTINDADNVSNLLKKEGLLAPRIEPWQLALHRWIIEIDGNVNSWGLLWKLYSGSCILRVESNHKQWYHNKLKPWVHVVPIEKNLADLKEKLLWCRKNPRSCEEIGNQGHQLAFNIVENLEEDQHKAVREYASFWFKG